MEQAVQLERRVRVIPATRQPTARGSRHDGKRRVAAYCRVSTDSEEQLNSYDAQKSYYTQRIEENPDWELAGIFADEGITGTSMKKRTEFKRMIAACKRGRIDMILTKSLSRFARNTVDCLDTVRVLKANGIGVIFEKENINTLTESSEFLITLFSGFAQAESESLSKNVRQGKQFGMKDGIVHFQYKKLLGYRRGEDGQPEIIPEEAETVRRIYRRYLEGASEGEIKKELDADNVPTSAGLAGWSHRVIHSILTNEKYIGDALLQKTYVTDCISKKVVRNQGELPMYYIENNHPGIIPKELFQRVQEEMARRTSKRKVMQKSGKTEQGKYSAKYALSELLVCGECGTPYKRCTWSRNGKKRIVWRCVSRLEFGTKYCHNSPTLDENKLHNAIVAALNQYGADRDKVIEDTLAIAGIVQSQAGGDGVSLLDLQGRLKGLSAEQAVLLDKVLEDMENPELNAQLKTLAEEKQSILDQIAAFQEDEEQRQLDWLEQRPYTTLFVSGNHENYDLLAEYPVEEWHGGQVQRIRPSVIHLMRGQVFDIQGKKFFTMGGASSHDIDGGILEPDDPEFEKKQEQLEASRALYRVNHVSWWREELPSEAEYQTARATLEKHGWKMDYILTHCCSTSVQDELSGGFYQADALTDFLDEVTRRCQFQYHFFGHYHTNTVIRKKHVLLYEQIIRLKL